MFMFIPPNLHATFSIPGLPALSVGINQDLLERLQLPVPERERSSYSLVLVERLIRVMSQAAQPGNTDTNQKFSGKKVWNHSMLSLLLTHIFL